MLGSFNVTISHVNHKFKFLSLDHLYHHRFYKYNYGFGGYIDQLFDTYYEHK